VAVQPSVRVQREDFSVEAAIRELTAGRRDVGAVVAFAGLARDEDGRLAALELEHYGDMARDEIARICEEAIARWPLTGLTVIHRHGRLAPGDNIVLVVAASAHRQAAFSAASFLMDYLKTRAPFWKKEHPAAGGEGQWVAAKADDDEAEARWKTQSNQVPAQKR
jgi:molybdopterin synthase catalytic subunit